MMRCYKCFGTMKLKGSVMRCSGCGAVMDPVEGDVAAPGGLAALRASIDFRPFTIAGGLVAAAVACGAAVYFLPDLMSVRPSPPSAPEPTGEPAVILSERPLAADELDLENVLGGWTSVVGTPETDHVAALASDLDGGAYVAIVSDDPAADGSITTLARIGKEGEIISDTPLADLADVGHIAISAHTNGDVFLVGQTADELVLERVNGAGETQWNRRVPAGGGGRGVATTSVGGGFVFAGAGTDANALRVEFLSAIGRSVWDVGFVRASEHGFVGLAPARAGGVYAAFYEPTDNDGAVAAVRLIDSDGEVVWRRTVDAAADSELAGVATAPDGGVFVLMSGLAPTLTYFNRAGRGARSMTLPATAVEAELAMTAAADGVFIGATYRLGDEETDIWLARIGPAGYVIWDEYPRIPGEDQLRFLAATSDGGVIAAGGLSTGPGADQDLFTRFALGATAPAAPVGVEEPPFFVENAPNLELVEVEEVAPDEGGEAPIVSALPGAPDILSESTPEVLEEEPAIAGEADDGDNPIQEAAPTPNVSGAAPEDLSPTTPPAVEETPPPPASFVLRGSSSASEVETAVNDTPLPVSDDVEETPDSTAAPTPVPQPTAFVCSIECISGADSSVTFPLNQTYVDQEPTPPGLFATLVKAEMLQLCLAMDQSVNMDANPTCRPQ